MSTKSRHTRKTFAVFLLAATVIATVSSVSAATKRKNPTSKLYVADVEGISSINTGDKIEDLTKKSVYSAEGTILETDEKSNNAIVLSNGAGVAFDPQTRLEMRRFVQEPFSPNRSDLETEPSVSQTQAFLPKGAIAICTGKMVAGSTMTYGTRQANIAIRARKLVIEATDNTTTVTVLEGEATIGGGGLPGGETLKSGQQAVITKPSDFSPPVIQIQPVPAEKMKEVEKKASIACMARKTVYFEEAKRKQNNANSDVFSEETEEADEIRPVEVLPGVINTDQTISPYKITK